MDVKIGAVAAAAGGPTAQSAAVAYTGTLQTSTSKLALTLDSRGAHDELPQNERLLLALASALWAVFIGVLLILYMCAAAGSQPGDEPPMCKRTT